MSLFKIKSVILNVLFNNIIGKDRVGPGHGIHHFGCAPPGRVLKVCDRFADGQHGQPGLRPILCGGRTVAAAPRRAAAARVRRRRVGRSSPGVR